MFDAKPLKTARNPKQSRRLPTENNLKHGVCVCEGEACDVRAHTETRTHRYGEMASMYHVFFDLQKIKIVF